MSSTGLQAVTDLVTLLTNNWNSANTDSITPTVVDNLTTLWDDLKFGSSDLLYVKNDAEEVKTGMYALSFQHDAAITIEVMTERIVNPTAAVNPRTHFKKMIDETVRIIKANARQSGYGKTVVSSIRGRYVKEKGMFIGVVEVELMKVNTS